MKEVIKKSLVYLSPSEKEEALRWLKDKEIPEERWKYVNGYGNHYEVSNIGRIRSWKNQHGGIKGTSKLLKQQFQTNGYLKISLSNKGKIKQYGVHRLVALHFVSNPNNKPQANHKLGIKAFNWANNLEWSTAKENTCHAHQNGLVNPARGEKQGGSKLTRREVREIRNRYRSENISQRLLGEEYDIGQTHVSRIVNNKYWSHI